MPELGQISIVAVPRHRVHVRDSSWCSTHVATGPSPCSSCCPWTLFVPSTPSRLWAPFVPIQPFAQLHPKWSCNMVKVEKEKKKSKIVGEKWNSGECNFFKPQLMSHIWLPAGPHKQLDWHILGGCWCLVRGNLKASLLQGSIGDPQLKPC